MSAVANQKKSWADDVYELEQPIDQLGPRKREEFVDDKGIVTIVEYTLNDEGKKVEIKKKMRKTLQRQIVKHVVAERKSWAKFGQERGAKPGPNHATTTIGEIVTLKISAGNKAAEQEPSQEDSIKANLAKAGAGKVTCRLCKGPHFTLKCPYKETLAGLDATGTSGLDTPPIGEEEPAASPAPASTGKYVPPSMRAGASGRGESMMRPGMSRDELPTLRITNVSEDTTDQDLRDLFGKFGHVVRVYIGKDRETGQSKGYAFVSFDSWDDADRARKTVHGIGYDNLILNCQWSQPRAEKEHRG